MHPPPLVIHNVRCNPYNFDELLHASLHHQILDRLEMSNTLQLPVPPRRARSTYTLLGKDMLRLL